MKPLSRSRREFFKTAAAGAALIAAPTTARTAGANDRIRFAVIGCGGMGTGHLGSLVKRGENRTTFACSPSATSTSGG